MKKAIAILSSLALLASGCDKGQTVEEPGKDSSPHLTVDIQVNYAADTRSVKSEWYAFDKIYVVFDHFFTDDLSASSSDTAYYMTLTYDGRFWRVKFSDEALEKYLLAPEHASGKLAAVFSTDLPNTGFSFSRTSVGSAKVIRLMPTLRNYSPGMFLYDQHVDYTVSNGKLTATLNMSIDDSVVHFFVPGLSDYNRFSFKSEHLGSMRFTFFMSTFWANDTDYRDPAVNHPANFDQAIRATVFNASMDGSYFCPSLETSVRGKETEYVIQLIDNNGTSGDESDDIVYTYTKTATLYGRESLNLPRLDSGKWSVNLRSDVSAEFSAFKDEVSW